MRFFALGRRQGERMLNASLLENHSVKLSAINASHEIAVYALQGAILGAWHCAGGKP